MKLGRLLDIFRACLENHPLLCGEKDGYPFISSLRAFAEAHVTLLPAPLSTCRSAKPFLGVEVPPTVSKGVDNPGLAHPPPLLGDGDRDNDMPVGVAGIVGSGPTKPFAGSPDVAPRLSFSGDDSCRFDDGGALAADECRRRVCLVVI